MSAQQQARALQATILRRAARDGLPMRTAREALRDSLHADVVRSMRAMTNKVRPATARTRTGDRT